MDDSTITLPLDIVLKDHKEFYSNFINVIEKKEEPLIKNVEVLRVMRLIDTLFISHKTKQRVRFED